MDKEIKESTNTLPVKDLSIAAFLYSCKELHLTNTERDRLGNVTFYFSPAPKAVELIDLYWKLQAPPIQPKHLFNSLRDLKDIIFRS